MKSAQMRVLGLSAAAVAGVCGSAHGQNLGQVFARAGFAEMPPRIPMLAPVATGDVLQKAPLHMCFAEGTDPRYMALINRQVEMYNKQFLAEYMKTQDPNSDYFYLGPRWPGASFGSPANLTWSFAADGTNTGGGASELFFQFDTKYPGGRPAWIPRFQQVFDRWQALIGVNYTRVTGPNPGGNPDADDGAPYGSPGAAGLRGDIRIAMRFIDGFNGVLAFNFAPPNGEMVMDSGEMVANQNFLSATNQYRFLRNTIAHENGHGLGLAHICSNNSVQLMEPFIQTSNDGPTQDDQRGLVNYYGDRFEDNESPGQATNVGALVNGGPVVTLGTPPAPIAGTSDPALTTLSFDVSADEDWFQFSVSQAAAVTVTATPVGTTYDNQPQQAGGACPGGNVPTDALRQALMRVEVYDTNGSTLLATNTAGALGQPASVVNVQLPGAGTYFARTVPDVSIAATQNYRILFRALNPSACPVFVQQPAPNTSLCPGTTLTLTADVVGAPTPTVQWTKDGNNIPGATGTTLVVTNVQVGDSGTYRLVATNSCGQQSSNAAVVTVTGAIAITQQPQNVVAPVGGTASFTVVATNATGVLWFKDGNIIPGATNFTYTINNVQLTDVGTYRAQVFNGCGFNQTSQDATLTIGDPCYPNCDGSTGNPLLTPADFVCFLNRYRTGDSYANCDGSTGNPALTPADFVCFLTRYRAGC